MKKIVTIILMILAVTTASSQSKGLKKEIYNYEYTPKGSVTYTASLNENTYFLSQAGHGKKSTNIFSKYDKNMKLSKELVISFENKNEFLLEMTKVNSQFIVISQEINKKLRVVNYKGYTLNSKDLAMTSKSKVLASHSYKTKRDLTQNLFSLGASNDDSKIIGLHFDISHKGYKDLNILDENLTVINSLGRTERNNSEGIIFSLKTDKLGNIYCLERKNDSYNLIYKDVSGRSKTYKINENNFTKTPTLFIIKNKVYISCFYGNGEKELDRFILFEFTNSRLSKITDNKILRKEIEGKLVTKKNSNESINEGGHKILYGYEVTEIISKNNNELLIVAEKQSSRFSNSGSYLIYSNSDLLVFSIINGKISWVKGIRKKTSHLSYQEKGYNALCNDNEIYFIFNDKIIKYTGENETSYDGFPVRFSEDCIGVHKLTFSGEYSKEILLREKDGGAEFAPEFSLSNKSKTQVIRFNEDKKRPKALRIKIK
jgi:hypothetical protein